MKMGWIAYDPDLAPRPLALTPAQTDTFFEAIAEGATVKAAGKLIGLTHFSAQKTFEDFRLSLGSQGE